MSEYDITDYIKENKVNNHFYGGANGMKFAVKFIDGLYMIKFPSPAARFNNNLSYSNGTISEHIGSTIFNILGVKAQKTKLYIAKDNKLKPRIVVACKDFTEDGSKLYEFNKIKNSFGYSSSGGSGTELSEILEVIESQNLIDKEDLFNSFWDMFIIDAYIGNFDRHNGNWGFLIKDDKISLAPIFDCGSCLFPQMDEDIMLKVMNDEKEFNSRVYLYPTSQIRVDNKKLNYRDYLLSTEDEYCLRAIIRIEERIISNRDKIHKFIIDEPLISKMQKDFYIKMLDAREKIIIESSYIRAKELINGIR